MKEIKFNSDNVALIFVDCEGHGPAPTLNNVSDFEFGAVEFNTRQSFHGKGASKDTFSKFYTWLNGFSGKRLSFISDNPAYDWQFINYYFHLYFRENPFGHSARRISDFYAGIVRDFHNTQEWKKLRKTTHDHNPVHDALGNLEAFEEIIELT